jgi:dinuclear metal center YbgI/SA1388 family protein
MANLNEIIQYTNEFLACSNFHDYCPNGLQVEGRHEVKLLVTGVTASLALIDSAIEKGADAIMVHHGYFWKGEPAAITGMKRRRLKRLLDADVSLLAYHLPLDAHPKYGNNIQLARQLNVQVTGGFGSGSGPDIGMYGRLASPLSPEAFANHIKDVLGRTPFVISGEKPVIEKLAWCTGAAQGYIEQAVSLGVDAYLTGEVSEQTVHVARECGIHFFAAGHHATERYGVKALGDHLAQQFALSHEFIDIDNPV